jgi:hypothetical protein
VLLHCLPCQEYRLRALETFRIDDLGQIGTS